MNQGPQQESPLDRLAATPEERERMEHIAASIENRMAGVFGSMFGASEDEDRPRRSGGGFPARMMAR